jgi:hypothetical protein
VITSKRTSPLTAHDAVAAESADLEASVVPVAAHTLTDADVVDRDRRFVDGVRTLRVGGATIKLNERILLVLGGVIAPLGLALVLLGYWGAANTPYLFEQVSYLISGGLLGLALVFLGAFFYFAHWLTQLVKEHRVQSVAMLEAIQRLQEEVARQSEPVAVPAPSRNGQGPAPELEAPPLVATSRGTMAHHPSCVVVAGKADLRAVTVADGLAPCKLCDPYA